MADLVDLEGRDEMLDDAEDTMDGEDNAGQKLKSTVEGSTKKQKGRGHTNRMDVDDRYGGARFDQLGGGDSGPGPARSVEGWIIIVSNVHEEAQEDDIHEAFADFGEIKNMHLNLDRRTGFVKGYALVEYDKKKEASDAIAAMNGAELLTQNLVVDWAFSKGPLKKGGRR